jgi:hypothetical protein
MAGKHTPGPWTHGHDGHGAFSIETDDCDGVQICYVRNEANARLIATAPELAEFAEYVRNLAFDFVNEGIRPHEHHMRDLAWRADKIVSKATRATQPLPPPNEESK